MVVAHEFVGELEPEVDIAIHPNFFTEAFNRGSGGGSQFSQLHDADVDDVVQIGKNVRNNVLLGGGQVFDLTHFGQQIHGIASVSWHAIGTGTPQ